MNKKGFTLIETALLMFITAILLSTGLTISNFSKSFLKFHEEKFLFADNLKKAQDLSFRAIDLSSLLGSTSTVCGVGMVITSNPFSYEMIAYATSSNELIDCYKIASDTPSVFDFSSKEPNLFYLKTNEFATNSNNPFLIKKDLKDFKAKFQKDNEPTFTGTTSLMFIHPYGELIIYNNGNEIVTTTTSFKNFYINLNRGNEYATITITNTGQILSE